MRRSVEPNLAPDNQQFNIVRHSLEQALEGSSMRMLREQFRRGLKPEACMQCWSDESVGRRSYREAMNDSFEWALPAALAGEVKLQYLSIQVGNVCNLRCRMCSPSSSRLLAREHALINEGNLESQEDLTGCDWPTNDRVWGDLLALSGQLRQIKFYGGEPFAVPQLLTFLRELSEAPNASQMSLYFNTNATLIKDGFLELIPKFGEVIIACSIDGFGPVQEYIRHPLRWSTIEENLARLKKAAALFSNLRVIFTSVVQLYNVFDLPRLVHFLRETCSVSGFVPDPALVTLTEPPALSARLLPPEAKRKAIDGLRALKHEAKDLNSSQLIFNRGLAAVIARIEAEDDEGLWPEFCRITRIYDQARGQKLETFVPELAPYLLTV